MVNRPGRCSQAEAEAIQGWLKGIGIKVVVVAISEARKRNFAQ